MEMNEVLYPGMEQRRLPDIVFNASRIDTSETHQLRVLVIGMSDYSSHLAARVNCSDHLIDGGGVRGLAALHILNKIMIRAHGEDYDAKNIKPCDVFDMICGTSTGG